MGDATELLQFDESTPDRVNDTKRRPLLSCEVHKDGWLYPVANTHFLYLKEGKSGEQHVQALRSLIGSLEWLGDFILCVAMVVARGSPLYEEFVRRTGYKDWVPPSIECTLDPRLHKLSALLESGAVPKVVVDYIFGSDYRLVGELVQFCGVSDYTPLLAEVSP